METSCKTYLMSGEIKELKKKKMSPCSGSGIFSRTARTPGGAADATGRSSTVCRDDVVGETGPGVGLKPADGWGQKVW